MKPMGVDGEIRWPRVFLLAACLTGLLLVVITPPFQVPDEYAHFFRAYDVSQGHWLARVYESRLGDWLPVSVPASAYAVSPQLPFHPDARMDLRAIPPELKKRLDPEKRAFQDFTNTAVASGIPYLAQAAGILLGRWAGLPPLALMYAGRLFNLAVWCLLMYWAIRWMPFGRGLLVLLALTPMSLFVAASLGYDATTNGVAFLATAVALRLALDPATAVTWRRVLFFTLLVQILSAAKPTYAVLGALFLMVSPQKAGGWRRYVAILAIVMAVPLFTGLSVTYVAQTLFVPYDEYNVVYRPGAAMLAGMDPARQIAVILQDIPGFVWLFVKAMLTLGPLYEFIGVLGWEDTPMPLWYVVAYLLLLGGVALTSGRSDIVLGWPRRALLAGVAAVAVLCTAVIIYLALPVGCPLLLGFQGRYLTPVAPLVFLLLVNRRLALPCRPPPWAVGLLLGGSTVVLMATLLRRYYL